MNFVKRQYLSNNRMMLFAGCLQVVCKLFASCLQVVCRNAGFLPNWLPFFA